MTLMARVEENDRGDKDAARMWLARAAAAPSDPAWVCDHCGNVSVHWAPHCPKCRTFDAFAWQTPPGAPLADLPRLSLAAPAEHSAP
jgi:HemY protein